MPTRSLALLPFNDMPSYSTNNSNSQSSYNASDTRLASNSTNNSNSQSSYNASDTRLASNLTTYTSSNNYYNYNMVEKICKPVLQKEIYTCISLKDGNKYRFDDIFLHGDDTIEDVLNKISIYCFDKRKDVKKKRLSLYICLLSR